MIFYLPKEVYLMAEGLRIAKGSGEHSLLPQMANRHGLIAGATGTGKTVTLRVIAENFSRIGVPVFMADVKAICPESPGPVKRIRKFASDSTNSA